MLGWDGRLWTGFEKWEKFRILSLSYKGKQWQKLQRTSKSGRRRQGVNEFNLRPIEFEVFMSPLGCSIEWFGV